MEHKFILSQSPFVEEAANSLKNKRKVSKRIKKLANSMYKNNGVANDRGCKEKENDQTKIVSILERRSVPDFLIEFVKKKRIFNLSLLRKIQLGKQADPEVVCLSTTNYMLKQEQELADLLTFNKEWRQERDAKIEQTKRVMEMVTPMTRKTRESEAKVQDEYSEYSVVSYNGFSAVVYERQCEEEVSEFSLMEESGNLMNSRVVKDVSSLFMTMY